MEKLTVTEVRKEIAKRNKEFKAATPAQQRVLIAKDVIEQLTQNRFAVLHNNFLVFPDGIVGGQWQKDARTEMLCGAVENCSGCALGALMLSCTLYNDKMTLGEMAVLGFGRTLKCRIEAGVPIANRLNAVFSAEQLRRIEQAFEGGKGAWYVSDYDIAFADEQTKAAIAFGEKYNESPKQRVIAIMQNIIDNNGEFKP